MTGAGRFGNRMNFGLIVFGLYGKFLLIRRQRLFFGALFFLPLFGGGLFFLLFFAFFFGGFFFFFLFFFSFFGGGFRFFQTLAQSFPSQQNVKSVKQFAHNSGSKRIRFVFSRVSYFVQFAFGILEIVLGRRI